MFGFCLSFKTFKYLTSKDYLNYTKQGAVTALYSYNRFCQVYPSLIKKRNILIIIQAKLWLLAYF